MKLKINEREATEFWMRFLGGLRLVREKRGERLSLQKRWFLLFKLGMETVRFVVVIR
jgi:hypothetical protein